MKKVVIIALVLGLFINSLFSQTGVDLKKYSLRDIPSVTVEEDKKYEKEGSLILRHCQVFDYHPSDDGKTIELWFCNHITIKIFNEEELKSYSKISLGKDFSDIISWEARTMDKNGKITIYGEQDIKDIEEVDEDGEKVSYKALIPYDLEKDGILEFYFISRKPVIINGGYYIQGNFTKKNFEFTIALPEHLEAEVISYNGAPNPIDTIIKNTKRRFYHISSELIPALSDESMAFYKANLQHFQFVISYNHAYSKSIRLNTIDTYAQNTYENITNIDKSAVKALKKLGSSMKITKVMSTEEKIRTIENYMKNNFYVLNYSSDKLSDVKSALESKLTNIMGIFRIYYYLFDQFGINNEIAITSDRSELKFDKNLNASNYFEEFLFYFPDIDQYLYPKYYSYRLGLTPWFLSNTDAVFLSRVTIGKISNFMTDIKEIPFIPMEATGDSLKIEVKVDLNNKILTGKLKRTLSGYAAYRLQANAEDSEVEEQEYLIKHYIGLGSENTNVHDEKFYNNTVTDVFLKPLIMTAGISSYEFIKFNNNEIVVNVGKLIGEQSKLEQKEERTQPVDLNNLRHYYRYITIEIPEDYKVRNLQDLNIEIYDTENPTTAKACFVSAVKQENNKIIIECSEYYNRLHYPVSEFANYQKVVNSAANFNNIKLYLEK